MLAPMLVAAAFGAPSKVVLWNSGTCPYAQRAWIALKEKGVDFEFKKVDLQDKEATPQFGEDYLKANPNKSSSSKVPVLVVSDEDGSNASVYTESKVLLDVIEDIWPEPPLLPSDVKGRYNSRVFSDVVYDGVFGGAKSPYKMAMRKLDADEGKGEWDKEEEIGNICEALSIMNESLEKFGSEGPFVCGEHFSFAECITAPFAQRASAVMEHFVGIGVVELCQSKGYDRAGLWWKAVLGRQSVIDTGVAP